MDINILTHNPLFWLALVWALVWKGLALWRAARKDDKVWFVVLFIVNTFGLLEILYLAIFGKDRSGSGSNTTTAQ